MSMLIAVFSDTHGAVGAAAAAIRKSRPGPFRFFYIPTGLVG
jgi:hypothetical protein